MKNRKISGVFALVLLALVSCSKDQTPVYPVTDAFQVDSKVYYDFQEAIDAAVKNEYPRVTLVDDATITKSVVIPEDEESNIAIDLMGHTLTLAENSTINCNRETSIESLDAGSIVGLESGAPLFRSSHNILFLNNDVSLIVPKGGVVIESDWGSSTDDLPEYIDPLYFVVNFSGTVSGDIILKNSSMTIDTEEGNFDIGTLSLKGAQCRCNVITERKSPVKINTVDGNVKNVSCVRAGDVKIASGGEAHVHDFQFTLVEEANCHERAIYLRRCSICGLEEYCYIDDDENPEYGECKKSELVHIEAKNPTDFEDGNTEYWRCPYCGKRYSDAEGKNEITDLSTTVIRLKDFYADYDMLHDLDEITFISDQNETKDASKLDIFNTVVGVTSAVSTLSGFNFLSIRDLAVNGWSHKDDDGDSQEKTDAQNRFKEFLAILANLSEKMDELNNKMDGIQNSVNLIGEKIESLKKQVSANGYFSVLYKRSDDVKVLKSSSLTAMKALYANVGKREEDIKRLFAPLESWAKLNPTAFEAIKKYLNDFSASNIIIQGLDKSINSIPALYQGFAESQEVWEHQAYPLRSQFLVKDHDLIIEPFLIACLYLDLVKNEVPCFSEKQATDPTTASILYDELQAAYKKYNETLAKDCEQMRERHNNIRKCLIREATCVLKPVVKTYTAGPGLDQNKYKFILNSKGKDVFCASVLQFQKDYGFDHDSKFLTKAQAQHIYDWYRANRTEKNFYDILKDDALIYQVDYTEHWYRKLQILAKNEDGYRNDNKCSVAFAELSIDYSHGPGWCKIQYATMLDDKGRTYAMDRWSKFSINKDSGKVSGDGWDHFYSIQTVFDILEYADEKWWK